MSKLIDTVRFGFWLLAVGIVLIGVFEVVQSAAAPTQSDIGYDALADQQPLIGWYRVEGAVIVPRDAIADRPRAHTNALYFPVWRVDDPAHAQSPRLIARITDGSLIEQIETGRMARDQPIPVQGTIDFTPMPNHIDVRLAGRFDIERPRSLVRIHQGELSRGIFSGLGMIAVGLLLGLFLWFRPFGSLRARFRRFSPPV